VSINSKKRFTQRRRGAKNAEEKKMKSRVLTDFGMGVVFGFIMAAIFFGVIFGFIYVHNRNKESMKDAERQIEIEALREDYYNRDSNEFLEIPDVRRAADGAADEFIRKRDEIIYGFRNRFAN